MTDLLALDPAIDRDRRLCRAVIETPRGNRTKYKYDNALGGFALSHLLPEGMIYPLDFGFIPGTCAGDGDAVDVMVLSEEPLIAGLVLEVRLVGVLEANQTEAGKTVRNDRLLAATRVSRLYAEVREPADIGKSFLESVEAFWVNYNALRGRRFEPLGTKGAEDAMRLVEQSRVKGA
ncbi:MAG TPA: inorganic diphosphatase [Caulobacteraceae bacterium]|jgi:inorganic pyrophosphatase|nr:inorganic diphosphatase [Caulobacteraceae bacterium]